jgi:hypothetical protein
MQGLPSKELEEYTPLHLKSPKGSPEGAINNDATSKIGSYTPLEESTLLINPLLRVIQDPLLL